MPSTNQFCVLLFKNDINSLYLKHKMLSYPTVSCFKEAPTPMTRYLIRRNLDQLIQHCIAQATQFHHTNITKGKALQQLKYTVLIAEAAATKHTEQVLRAIVKLWPNAEDIPRAFQTMHQIVQILGWFGKGSYFVPLVLEMLTDESFKNSPKNTIILLNILAHMLSGSAELQPHLKDLAITLKTYETQFYDNDEGLLALLNIMKVLLTATGDFPIELLQVGFQVLLNVLATKTIAEQRRAEAAKAMEQLAVKGGFKNIAELHASQIGPILGRLMEGKEYTSWNRTSKNRFKFDSIVRNCSSEVARFLPEIVQVLEWMVGPNNDLQVRMDTLVLVQHILSQPQLKEALIPLSQLLLKRVLLPAIQWKVGKPQIKIRKAGVINIIILIEKGLINSEQLLECFKDLLPHLKNCLSDDWAPELRLASCQLIEQFLLATKQTIGDDELRDLYPLLLQRLDDSQDPIRLKVTAAINVFFSCQYIKLSESTIEYMIGAIMVHLDDASPDIQQAVFVSLRHAAVPFPKLVLSHAKNNLPRMKHTQLCSDLVEYCQERLQEDS